MSDITKERWVQDGLSVLHEGDVVATTQERSDAALIALLPEALNLLMADLADHANANGTGSCRCGMCSRRMDILRRAGVLT